MRYFICLLLALTFVPIAYSWDGYDYDSSSYIEIDRGQLVRTGREIEYYDYGKGEYRYGDVESIRRHGSSVEIEVRDHESGENRTFEMDGN